MASIPRRFAPLPPAPASVPVVEPARAPTRNVIDLPPVEGYLGREILRLPQAGAYQGDEDMVVVRDGKALRGNIRDMLELARRGIDAMLLEQGASRGYGGGGRHTYENAVRRATETTSVAGDQVLIVRNGRSYAVDIGAAIGPRVFALSIPISGKPSNAENIECHVFVDAVTFPASFANSRAKADIAATASTVFNILKNNVSVATVTFGIGATTGTFTMASSLSMAIGDTLDLLCPATADATLANIKITLRGTVA